jgi:type I restriction enzyme M protein
LVKGYLAKVCTESAAIPEALAAFDGTLTAARTLFDAFSGSVKDLDVIPDEQRQPLANALAEWWEAQAAYETDRATLLDGLAGFRHRYDQALPSANEHQHAGRAAFDPLSDKIKGLIKQADLLYKLAARAVQLARDTAKIEEAAEFFDRAATNKRLKQLDQRRKDAVGQLKLARYFHRQIAWLQDRFPDAAMQAVPGLCKVVTRAEIEAVDWSLTPGRFVGVAPPEEDEDFDFEQTLRDIHVELADLNREAAELATRIQENFEELGV